MLFYSGFSEKEEIALKHFVLKQVTTFAINKCHLLKLKSNTICLGEEGNSH